MRVRTVLLPLFICFVLSQTLNAQTRGRTRIRTNISRPKQSLNSQEIESRDNENNGEYDVDNTPEPALQYYNSPQSQDEQPKVVLVTTDDEFNGFYGQPTASTRSRSDFTRSNTVKSSSVAARSKEVAPKETIQTIRNYSKVNDDGSFTFGYEAADGSFKEETRGTDCVVKGKYGYIDPDGNKREFTYVSGNPCDPNNPDQNEDESVKEDEANEPENIPLNFPRKPLRVVQRPQTTTHSPTTVFQNQYTSNSYNIEQEDDEHEDENQLLQPQRPRVSARPQHIPVPEVTIRQKPPLYQIQKQTIGKVADTTSRPYGDSLQTNPPATTYRPAIQFFTQKATPITFSKPIQSVIDSNKSTHFGNTRRPVDFAAEFSKFQQENNIATTTTPSPRILNQKTQKIELPNVTQNPIFETQLVFDPQTGQIDSTLFPQNVAYRIPATFVSSQQQTYNPSQQLVTLEQLQHQNQAVYQRPLQASTTRSPVPSLQQFSQQIYHKDHENLQVLNSQQLYAQQQQLQQHQLQNDRLEARRQSQIQPNHRFQLGGQNQIRSLQHPGFFYQPSSIDSFL